MTELIFQLPSIPGVKRSTHLKAQTVLPSGDRIEVSKKDIFEEKLEGDWKRLKFTFPQLEEGAIIEFQYDLESENILQLREWYFQTDIPTRWSEYRLNIPEWYNYVTLKQGAPLTIEEVESTTGNLYVPGYRTRTGAFGQNEVVQRGRDAVEAKIYVHRYVLEDAPAMKSESYITTMDDYLSKIRFQLNNVRFPGGGDQTRSHFLEQSGRRAHGKQKLRPSIY